MQDAFDVVVVGGGIIGRLTAWLLAKSGKHTLLLERNSIDRPKGSSRGNSRAFGDTHLRSVYFNLARQSRHLWRELEREVGKELLYLNGGLDISSGRDGIKKIASKLRARRSPYDLFEGVAFSRKYPQWKLSSKVYALYSPNAGILRADRCMNAAVSAAKNHGVLIRDKSRVVSVDPGGPSKTIFVKISSGKIYRTQKLVIAAGPWAQNILMRLGVALPLYVSQEQTVYFAPCRNAELFMPENFPVWDWDGSDFVYGFPIFENDGIKVAFHDDGHHLKNLGEFRYTPNASVIKRLRLFLNQHLPDAAGEDFGATTCLYTNTSDDDFVIDTIPGYSNIVYFTGDNGHAFHCAPAVSKTLAELVYEGKTSIDISRFRASRFNT